MYISICPHFSNTLYREVLRFSHVVWCNNTAAFGVVETVSVGDCRVKKPVPVTSFPSGYLASYVTELTGCGGPFTPWLVEASPGQTIQLTLYNFSLSASGSSSSLQSRVRSASCSAFAVVTEPAVVTRNVTVCGGGGDKTGRKRLVYSSVTNRLLLSVWLQQQLTEDTPYFMLKYEGE